MPCTTLKGHMIFTPVSLPSLSITTLTLQQAKTLLKG